MSPLMAASAASAFSVDRRRASERGCSDFFGVSSISIGIRRDGSIPAWLSRSTRRGEPEARMSLYFSAMEPRPPEDGEKPFEPSSTLLETIGDAALGQVVGGHFDENLVARQNADAVLAHAAGRVGDDLVFVFEL